MPNSRNPFTLDFGQPRRDEVPETYPKGRVCPCRRTILSIYNPNKVCWQCVARIAQQVAELERDVGLFDRRQAELGMAGVVLAGSG